MLIINEKNYYLDDKPAEQDPFLEAFLEFFLGSPCRNLVKF
jgi:hypothetical protein